MLLHGVNLWQEYPRPGGSAQAALRGASIEVESGQLIAVVGPSGAGKSTLLNALGLVRPPTRGELYWQGQPVKRMSWLHRARLRRRELAVVSQFFQLPVHRTVLGAVRAALGFNFPARSGELARARAAVETVGLTHAAKYCLRDLSAGEQQRVALACALVRRPRLLLADEPAGHLDTAAAWDLVSALLRHTETGMAIVLATHDPQVASRAHRVYHLRAGELTETDAIPTWEDLIDRLTGVYNPNGLETAAVKLESLGLACSILVFDIDLFSELCAEYGRKVADIVLREVSSRLQAHLRRDDGLGRYGDQEFAVLMKGSDLAAAAIRAEELRAQVAAKPFLAHGNLISVTVSIGVATYAPGRNTWDSAMQAAERRLDQARLMGRNRVVYADPGVGALL